MPDEKKPAVNPTEELYQSVIQQFGGKVTDQINREVIKTLNVKNYGVASNVKLWDKSESEIQAMFKPPVSIQTYRPTTPPSFMKPDKPPIAPLTPEQATQPVPEFVPGGSVGMGGEDLPEIPEETTILAAPMRWLYFDILDGKQKAVAFDKYGKPVFERNKDRVNPLAQEGQVFDAAGALISDVENGLANWFGNQLYEFTKPRVGQQAPITEEEKKRREELDAQLMDFNNAKLAQEKTGQQVDLPMTEAEARVLQQQINEIDARTVSTVGTNLENLPFGIHYITRAVKVATSTGLQTLAAIGHYGKRASTTPLIAARYALDKKPIMMEEAYQVSRIAGTQVWDEISGFTEQEKRIAANGQLFLQKYSGALMDEFLRRYRDGENAKQIGESLENPTAELIVEAAFDFTNFIPGKAAASAGKEAIATTVEFATKLDKVADAVKTGNAGIELSTDIAKAVEAVPDVLPRAVKPNIIKQLTKDQSVFDAAKVAADEARDKLNVATKELNDLVKSGATQDIIDAKKASIKPIRAEATKAKKAADAAEKNFEITTKRRVADEALAIDEAKSATTLSKEAAANVVIKQKEATILSAVDSIMPDVLKNIDEVKSGLINTAKSTGLSAKIASAKVAFMENVVNDVMQTVLHTVKDPAEVRSIIRDMTIVMGSSGDARKLALARLVASPVRNVVFSRGGMQTAELFNDMFRGKDGLMSFTNLENMVRVAQQADEPLAKFTELLHKKMEPAIKNMFPDILTRVKNAESINDAIKQGKPIEKYLQRFVVNGKAEEIPEGMIAWAKAHEKVGKPIVGGINKTLAFIYMSANPAYAARNLMQNVLTAFFDTGIESFPTYWSNKKIVTAHGIRFSGWDKGFSAGAFMGSADLAIKGQGVAFSKLSGDFERGIGNVIWAKTFTQEMKKGYRVMFKDIGQRLMQAGLSPEDVRKLESLALREGGVDNAFKAFMSSNPTQRRVLEDIANDGLINQLAEYGLDDMLTEAMRKANNPDEFELMADAVYTSFENFGRKSLLEEPVISEMMGDEMMELSAMAEKYGVDPAQIKPMMDKLAHTISAEANAKQDAMATVNAIRKSAIKEVMNVGDEQLMDDVLEIFSKAEKNVYDIGQLRNNQHKALLDKYLGMIRTSKLDKEKSKLWTEYFSNRGKLHTNFRNQVFSAYGEIQTGLQTKLPNLDLSDFDKLNSKFEWAKSWDNAEMINGIWHADNFELDLPIMDTTPSLNRAYFVAKDGVRQSIDTLKDLARKNWNVADTYQPGQEQALSEALAMLKARESQVVSAAGEIGNGARDFALIDYTDRTGADVALAYLYPYHFWYGRTYGHWFKRIMANPKIATNYARYRANLEKKHAGMPDWYKYQVSTNELFGLESEHPLYLNLEATLNPLNGVLGIDYDDPARQKDDVSMLLSEMGKLGPTTWSGFGYLLALNYLAKGDKDAADAWAGRLIPATSTIKGATALMGWNKGKGIELDPVILLKGGIDRSEYKRLGGIAAGMVKRGEITQEQAMEAIDSKRGDVWEQILAASMVDPGQPALGTRAAAQVTGGLLGVGFKGRSDMDMLIMRMQQEKAGIISQAPNMSPEEYREAWFELSQKYDFADLYMMTRMNEQEKDMAYAYSVLSRIPPGKVNQMAELVGLDDRLVDMFYNTKGRVDQWSRPDRDTFMSAIRNMSGIVAIPNNATKAEYSNARSHYKQVDAELQRIYGTDILDKIDRVYEMAGEYDEINAYLRENPEVQEAMDDKDNWMMSDPLLSKYYGGIEDVERYEKNMMYREAKQLFGEDILELSTKYRELGELGGNTERMKDAYPQLEKYWEWKDAMTLQIANRLSDVQKFLPDTPMPVLREDAILDSIAKEDLYKALADNLPETKNEFDPLLVPFLYGEQSEDKFSITGYVTQMQEQYFPGITPKIDEWKSLAAASAEAAQQYLSENPEVALAVQLDKKIRKEYNKGTGAFNVPASELSIQINSSLSPSEKRLVLDYKLGGKELSGTMKTRLNRIAQQYGMSLEGLIYFVQP